MDKSTIKSDHFEKAKKLFDEINKAAAQTPLAQVTQEEIELEIKNYRNGK